MPAELKPQLCSCLLRVRAMEEQNNRSLYISELEERFGSPLNVPRYPDAHHDVWSVLNVCFDHPGLLRSFAEILRCFFGESTPVTDFERLVNQIEPTPFLEPAHRDQLIRLVKQTPTPKVVEAYRVLAEASASTVTPDWTDPDSVITAVEYACVAAEDRSILQRFVELLPNGGGGMYSSTPQWVDNPGHRPPLDPQSSRKNLPEQQRAFDEPTLTDRNPDASATGPSRDRPLRVWGGVPLRNPKFTGREALLRQLDKAIERSLTTSVFPHVLHGLGGVGKTQLAVEYLHQYGERYDLVWWIDASKPGSIIGSLNCLGQRLGLPADRDKRHSAHIVLDALGTAFCNWLLVYDNADQPDDVSPLMPSRGGTVILTSRNVDWTTRWTTTTVHAFDRKSSIDLLRKHNSAISADLAESVAEKLGDLPLALEQAANFQTSSGMSPREYVDLVEDRAQELLAEGKPSDYPTTIAVLFKRLLAKVRHAAPEASEILGLFAHLGPAPISAELLRSGWSIQLSPGLGNTLRDPIRLNHIIRELPRHGLARIHSQGQRIQVHRLVQLMLRTELDDQQRAQCQNDVRNLLATANPSHPDSQDTWHAHAELGPHILPADLIHADSYDARLVALDQSRYLFQIGNFAGSRDVAQAAFAAWSKPQQEGGLGPDHEQTVLASRHLANALRNLGSYEEARQLDEDTFTLLRTNPAFGDDHVHTVGVAFGIGIDLSMAGDLTGSLQRDRENLDRAVRVYGPTHEQTLQAKGNVAADLRLLGRYEEARRISQSLVDEYRQVIGESHPRTLWAVSELVRDLYGLGEYSKALEAQTRIWDRYLNLREPQNRTVLLADHNVVIALRKTGNTAAALDRALENYYSCHAKFGHEHEYTLMAAMSHANTLRIAGRLDEARIACAEAADGYTRKFGKRHWLTLAAKANQGIILRLLGELQDAYRLEKATFEQLCEILGDEHPYTLCTACNLANSLVLAHKMPKARELTSWALDVSRRVRGESHPDTLACALNAALDVRTTDGEATGQQLFAEAIQALERVLGSDHPETLDAIRGRRANSDIEPPPM
ncbi:MAG: tetratricopeptide repeat protein [Dactylosporangium sp.]|nr:tetratricopeptide repeat protein [Dactylosporangium sp.]NNJ60148.1 tetratricopeptide repeat protein [Dactylosporangium sp.]